MAGRETPAAASEKGTDVSKSESTAPTSLSAIGRRLAALASRDTGSECIVVAARRQ
jgi:hypothetical protein